MPFKPAWVCYSFLRRIISRHHTGANSFFIGAEPSPEKVLPKSRIEKDTRSFENFFSTIFPFARSSIRREKNSFLSFVRFSKRVTTVETHRFVINSKRWKSRGAQRSGILEKKKLLFFAKQNGKITLPLFDFVKSLMDVFSRDQSSLRSPTLDRWSTLR